MSSLMNCFEHLYCFEYF